MSMTQQSTVNARAMSEADTLYSIQRRGLDLASKIHHRARSSSFNVATMSLRVVVVVW